MQRWLHRSVTIIALWLDLTSYTKIISPCLLITTQKGFPLSVMASLAVIVATYPNAGVAVSLQAQISLAR